jgi:transcriptional regulator with XRE-family HTH domain
MVIPLKQEAVGAHVRRLRLDARLSLRALATRTEFSPSFISQLENGLVSPSINSMQKIAEALGVTLGEFFAAAAEGQGGSVVRASERPVLSSTWSHGSVEALASMVGTTGKPTLEPVLITLEAGGRSGKHPYARPQPEFAFVVEGNPRLTLGPDTHAMRAGDSASILPRELRLWFNEGPGPARILVVSLSTGAESKRPRARRRS